MDATFNLKAVNCVCSFDPARGGVTWTHAPNCRCQSRRAAWGRPAGERDKIEHESKTWFMRFVERAAAREHERLLAYMERDLWGSR